MNKRQAKKQSKKMARLRAERVRPYSTKYFSTGAEMQSAVNRINSRMRTIAKHLGNDSKILQDMYTQIDLLIPIKNQRFNADGVLQISSPYDLFKNKDLHEVIHNFDKHDIKTYADIKSEYQRGFESFQESDEFFDEDFLDDFSIDDYINTFSEIMDALSWAYDNNEVPEGQEILEIMRQSKKSYSDLVRVKALYISGVTK